MAKQVVILAAGLGTRLGRPHPKPLTQLRSGESIMRRAVDALRTAYGDDVFVTAVVGFKLDLVIEAMPDISFVYNEVYDSTNTSKSLLKALKLSQPGGVLWLNGDVVFDPQVLPLIQEHIETGRSFVCVNTESVAEEEVKYTLDDDGYIKELSKQVVGGLGEAVGINFIAAEDKADAARAAGRGGRPGLLRARHRGGHRAGRPARRGPGHLPVPHRRGRLRRGPDPGQRVRRELSGASQVPDRIRVDRVDEVGVHLTGR